MKNGNGSGNDDEPLDDILAARELAEAEAGEGETIQYEDGFTIKTLIGALFVGLVMAPGAIYLGLVAGQGLGPAAQWVTIVLFAEVCRRSFLPLKRQEIYILYYVAGGLASVALSDRGISGGPFGGLIWNQYFIQSTPAANIAREIPNWVAPQATSPAIIQRTFLHPDWTPALIVLFLSNVLERVSWIPAGYILFRATSDVERLPFPLAPVAAAGATALAESSSKEESWRWNVFSTGTTIGLVFGAFYVAIPVITGVAFGKALTLLPIPFMDLTNSTETILPAAPVGISADLGKVLTGFVLPFPIVAGSFISSMICQVGLNPIFYHLGLLPDYKPSMDAITMKITNNFDMWLSVGIGIQLAIAIIGLWIVVKSSIEAARKLKDRQRGSWSEVPAGRGDKPSTWKIAAIIWFAATLAYVGLTKWLLPGFSLALLLIYAFVWTPLNSFVSARMFGLTSQSVNFPYLKELTIMKSGYRNIDVWYAPMPLHDYGGLAQSFREIELTGTKFISVIKAELVMLPVLLISGLVYWQFIWHTSPIPSSQYPFALKMWPILAVNQAIWNQINKAGGAAWVLHSIRPPIIAVGGVTTLALYGLALVFKIPLLGFYGAASGANAFPSDTIPTFLGACLGRYYFARRFGLAKWNMYAPVLLAGFACGTGLMGMGAIALALISKAVQPLPF